MRHRIFCSAVTLSSRPHQLLRLVTDCLVGMATHLRRPGKSIVWQARRGDGLTRSGW